MQDIFVKVPATSANLGPGFDLFGLALNQYAYFRLTFQPDPDQWFVSDVSGNTADLPPDQNLIRTGFQAAMKKSGLKDSDYNHISISTRFRMDLPVGSGFGSSACALTAGVMAANHYLKVTGAAEPLTLQEEMDLLTELEGHPDNAVPARIGGFVFSAYSENKEPVILKKNLPQDLGLAVIVPAFQISTSQSRKELPGTYSVKDILENIKGSLLWLEYLHTGRKEFLIHAIGSDRLHETYRGRHIPLYPFLRESIEATDCFGMTISGSGPGILIYYPKNKEVSAIQGIEELIRRISREKSFAESPVRICLPDPDGAVLFTDPSMFPF